MRLITAPRTPPTILVLSWVTALIVAGTILYLVFNFGYYASGLAAYKQDRKLESEKPIPVRFEDPNAPKP